MCKSESTFVAVMGKSDQVKTPARQQFKHNFRVTNRTAVFRKLFRFAPHCLNPLGEGGPSTMLLHECMMGMQRESSV